MTIDLYARQTQRIRGLMQFPYQTNGKGGFHRLTLGSRKSQVSSQSRSLTTSLLRTQEKQGLLRTHTQKVSVSFGIIYRGS